MKRKVLCLLLMAALLSAVGMAWAKEPEPVKGNGCPYHIMVNRAACVVTVYGLDEEGYYTQPVRTMICSVGRKGHATPRGTFALTGQNKLWCYMLDGTYGQYSCQFSGYYLFHSVCYRAPSPDALLTEEYNMLGQPASLGCVRLQTGDAKWIYDNCGAGTTVTIYDGEAAELPERQVDRITPETDNGWDPTDPKEGNPWGPPWCSVRDQSLLRDGEQAKFQSCVVTEGEDGEKLYVRLRSLALMLSSTSARFQVGWDGTYVTLHKGRDYIPDGSEWIMPSQGRRPYMKERIELLVDGSPVTLEAVSIQSEDGKRCSYYRLEDLEKYLDFHLGWDEELGTLIVTE